MNNETLKAVTELADKLGTTTEYLWGVLLKQAPISGFLSIILCVSLIAALSALIWFVHKTAKRTKDDGRPYFSQPIEKDVAWAMVMFSSALVVLTVAVNISNIVSAFFNPEYWALQQILNR